MERTRAGRRGKGRGGSVCAAGGSGERSEGGGGRGEDAEVEEGVSPLGSDS